MLDLGLPDSDLQTLRFGRTLITGVVMLLATSWAIAGALILPKSVFHFHELVITSYANGTMDFSADASGLIRSLGIVSLLTLVLGLVIGLTIGLTASNLTPTKNTALQENRTETYEHALSAAGLMSIKRTPDGTTYQLTEHGRQFLRDYAFLRDREAVTIKE